MLKGYENDAKAKTKNEYTGNKSNYNEMLTNS